MSVVEYLRQKQFFQTKYGPLTLVLMQVGSFFEFYSDVEDPFHYQVAELINILVTKRNKSNPELNIHNPYMCGFGTSHLPRYLDILIKAGYTVVLIEQVTAAPEPIREITRIISPGTHIDGVADVESPGVAAIYFMADRLNWFGWLSYIDISTGYTAVHQFQYPLTERHLFLEEIHRWIDTFQPREWLLLDAEPIKDVFQGKRAKIHQRMPTDCRIAQLNHFLGTIYHTSGLIGPMEQLGFERSTELAICFVELLRFVYEENRQIAQKLQVPEHWTTIMTMTLLNDAVHQLKLYGTNPHEPSVYHILQKCCTSGGKRLLKHRLLNPILDADRLEDRWNWISWMDPLVERMRSMLRSMVDYERLHRKIAVGLLHPFELAQLDRSYGETLQMVTWLQEHVWFAGFMQVNRCTVTVMNMRQMIEDLSGSVNKDEIYKSGPNQPYGRIFLPGQFVELDEHWNRLVRFQEELGQLRQSVAAMFPEVDRVKVELVDNDRDGYFISVLSKRCTKQIESALIAAGYTLHVQTKDRKRVTSEQVHRYSHLVKEEGDMIQRKTAECWRLYQGQLYEKYSELWKAMHHLTSELDYYQNGAYVARENGYVRPRLMESGLKMEGLRHPIIERVHEGVLYVKNDVCLGQDEPQAMGMLLYGVNGAGKSSLGKAVGINLIMAQMGYYVACDAMSFCPYHRIFTRITSEDNIYKGHSSFVVEMNDLRSILRYSDARSMIIGDEICRGTESISGLSIVASALMTLIRKRCTFLLATHQHTLMDIPEIAELPGLHVYHLTIDFLPNGEFQYGRRMMLGRGPDLYGLEIARHVLQDEDFYERAMRIRDRLTGVSDGISTVTSSYNRDVIVQHCEICKSRESLESHHIEFQERFEGRPSLAGVRKDQAGNLVVLCERCHDRLHGGRLEIDGWREGSEGRVLQWREVTEPQQHQRAGVRRRLITDEMRGYVQEHRELAGRIGVRQFLLQMKRDGYQLSETSLRNLLK